jgi:MerR family transcriptional regulator/heat shock protein HspR
MFLSDDMLIELMKANIEPEIFVSKAAKMTKMHPQTLRQYDRAGIVSPKRTKSPTRRYSKRDLILLKEVQKLASKGINKIGIKHIIDLQNLVLDLQSELESLKLKFDSSNTVFETKSDGGVYIAKRTIVKDKNHSSTEITIYRENNY